MQLGQSRDRKEEDDQIHGDVYSRADVNSQLEVDAMSTVLSIPLLPKEADGLALHGKEDAHGHKVGGERTDDSVAKICEVTRDFAREDAKVQENDRDLCDDDDGLVDVLLDPEDLYANVS